MVCADCVLQSELQAADRNIEIQETVCVKLIIMHIVVPAACGHIVNTEMY